MYIQFPDDLHVENAITDIIQLYILPNAKLYLSLSLYFHPLSFLFPSSIHRSTRLVFKKKDIISYRKESNNVMLVRLKLFTHLILCVYSIFALGISYNYTENKIEKCSI